MTYPQYFVLYIQVDWQRKRGTYWVRFIHIEVLEQPPCVAPSGGVLRVGDRVRVKSSVVTPAYKWGSVTHRSVGVISKVEGGGGVLVVDFPEQVWSYPLLPLDISDTVQCPHLSSTTWLCFNLVNVL